MHASSIRIMILLLAQALCAASCYISPARADETAPADTSGFVSYCEDPGHFDTCRLAVVVVNNRTLIAVTFNHQHGCLIPNELGENTRARSGVATKAILAYLKTAAASRPPNTNDAILAAIKALWPQKCE